MSVQIGLLTSEKKLIYDILDILQGIYKKARKATEPISLIHLKDVEKAYSFIKFEFPDFLFIDIDNQNVNISDIIDTINQDPWLHTTGVVVFYREYKEEYKYLLNNMTVLSFVDIKDIKYQLERIFKIVIMNKQVAVQHNIAEAFLTHKSGSFTLDNDPSMVTSYVNIITSTLLNEKYIKPAQENGLRIALTELLMNAIEHGNCEISYEEKSSFLETGGDITELIRNKNQDKNVSARKVYLEYHYNSEYAKFIIRDCGEGFDHNGALYDPTDEEHLWKKHGRGVFLTKHYVHSLEYNDKGNEVTMVLNLEKDEQSVPKGFADQDVIHVKSGDIVFEQGARSNSLYYIVTGIYDIEVNDVKLAQLTPSDIFLGEMAFLLNNKRVASVRAATEGKLIEIKKNQYIDIIKNYPQYSLLLSKLLASRLEKTNKRQVEKIIDRL